MFAYSKQLQLREHTRRYSIVVTTDGWEVREERDSEVVRQSRYQDWHRVERAKRTMASELEDLRNQGWIEIATSQAR